MRQILHYSTDTLKIIGAVLVAVIGIITAGSVCQQCHGTGVESTRVSGVFRRCSLCGSERGQRTQTNGEIEELINSARSEGVVFGPFLLYAVFALVVLLYSKDGSISGDW